MNTKLSDRRGSHGEIPRVSNTLQSGRPSLLLMFMPTVSDPARHGSNHLRMRKKFCENPSHRTWLQTNENPQQPAGDALRPFSLPGTRCIRSVALSFSTNTRDHRSNKSEDLFPSSREQWISGRGRRLGPMSSSAASTAIGSSRYFGLAGHFN